MGWVQFRLPRSAYHTLKEPAKVEDLNLSLNNYDLVVAGNGFHIVFDAL